MHTHIVADMLYYNYVPQTVLIIVGCVTSFSSDIFYSYIFYRMYKQFFEWHFSYIFVPFFSDLKKKLLLWTVYSLSMKYCPSDISLAVSCGLLPLLFSLSGGTTHMSYIMPSADWKLQDDQLSLVLQMSSGNLMRLITLTAG